MAKVDKLEMKYQKLKSDGFDAKKLEEMKKANNSDLKDIQKEEKNRNDRRNLGELNIAISELESKKELKDDEKEKLRQLKLARKTLLEERKKENSLDSYQKGLKEKAEMELLEGFVNNKEKIEKILKYRDKIKTEIEKKVTEKTSIDDEIKKIGEIKETKEELEEKIEEAKKPESKLTDKEYLDLVESMKNIDKLTKLKENSKKLEKEIKTKKMMVTKCNLAWKNLFRNKSWDDIHLKAIKMKDNKIVKEEKKENIEKTGKQNENINKTDKIETKDLIEYDEFAQKHPWLAKARDRIKKVKNWFFEEKEESENKDKNKDKNKEEKQKENKEEKQEENKEEKENKRDAFIEELRRYVENDKSDLEKAYEEKHKRKEKEAKTKKTKESDGREPGDD